MASHSNPLYRKLPSVDEVLRSAELTTLVEQAGQQAVTESARIVLDRLRTGISAGTVKETDLDHSVIVQAIEDDVDSSLAYSLRSVINATGVVLHTNLGRAPLSHAALAHITQAAQGYSNIEFDLVTGERGKRDVHVARLFERLLNPHATYPTRTIVVNNCAAAVLIALNTLAEGGEVIVSRGELVEIGGSFRVPDVMAKSGAILREVGTTNRTRLADYEQAITERTKLILRVHRSNFAMTGFTEQPSLEELSALGRKRGIPVMEDLGNGAMMDLADIGLKNEGGVAASLRAGIDLITYSGDKLFGGPQAGLITGRDELVARARKNPLFRALRVDKMYYAALEATLLDYLRGDFDAIPTLLMARIKPEAIRTRTEAIHEKLNAASGALKSEVVSGASVIGGGTTPDATLPTYLLAITHNSMSAAALLDVLRKNTRPIIARVEDDRVLLDLRTVFLPGEDSEVLTALQALHQSR